MDVDFLFKLPDDSETIVSLMACLPKDQNARMSTWLEAPKAIPEVLDDVKLVLDSDLTTPRKLFSNSSRDNSQIVSGIAKIIAKDSLPAILEVNECSSDLEQVNYLLAKNLAEEFITKGYRGVVRYSFYPHPDFDHTGSCIFYLGRTWRDHRVHDCDKFELGISIKRGYEKTFEPLLDACEKSRVQQIKRVWA